MQRWMYPLSLFVLTGSLFAADPFAGTWKLNSAQSKFAPGQGMKEGTQVILEQGDHVMVTTKGVAADGSKVSVNFTVSTSGGEAAKFLEGGPPPGVSVMYAKKKTDAKVVDTTTVKDGKVLETGHTELSGDGKSLRLVTKGTDAQGKPYESVLVADRVK